MVDCPVSCRCALVFVWRFSIASKYSLECFIKAIYLPAWSTGLILAANHKCNCESSDKSFSYTLPCPELANTTSKSFTPLEIIQNLRKPGQGFLFVKIFWYTGFVFSKTYHEGKRGLWIWQILLWNNHEFQVNTLQVTTRRTYWARKDWVYPCPMSIVYTLLGINMAYENQNRTWPSLIKAFVRSGD